MIEKILTSKIFYQGKILNLSLSSVLLPNSRITNQEIIEHTNSVVVIALDNYDRLILVKQYRVSIGKLLFEFPAGAIDDVGIGVVADRVDEVVVRAIGVVRDVLQEPLAAIGVLDKFPGDVRVVGSEDVED